MNCFLMVVKSRSVPTSVNDDSTNQEVYSRPNDITVVAQVHMQRVWEKRHRVHSSSWGQLHIYIYTSQVVGNGISEPLTKYVSLASCFSSFCW